MSDSSWPHGLQHTRPPCPSPTPRVYPNSCPLSWWYHPTISSSVIPFSSWFQSFPASGSFLMSQLFAWSGQSIGTSASASVLPMNIQDWFPLGLTVWSPSCPRDSQESSPMPQFKSIKFSAFFIVQLLHPYMGLKPMGLQRVRHDWATELNWTERASWWGWKRRVKKLA